MKTVNDRIRLEYHISMVEKLLDTLNHKKQNAAPPSPQTPQSPQSPKYVSSGPELPKSDSQSQFNQLKANDNNNNNNNMPSQSPVPLINYDLYSIKETDRVSTDHGYSAEDDEDTYYK